MVSSLNPAVLLAGAVLLASSTFADGTPKPLKLSSGVCYSTRHLNEVTAANIAEDLNRLVPYFSSIRTYHAQFGPNVNLIALAASANLSISVGVYMGEDANIESEIEAVCQGVADHGEFVEAVYVGNENLLNGGRGIHTVDQLIGYIKRVKACVGGKVPVGTAQRDTVWLATGIGADALASACDVVGCNIQPFFMAGLDSAVERLNYQWTRLSDTIGHSKVRLTETGWPHNGPSYLGNVASTKNMQLYFDEYRTKWTGYGKALSYWYIGYDSNLKTGQEFQHNFGIFDLKKSLNIRLPTRP